MDRAVTMKKSLLRDRLPQPLLSQKGGMDPDEYDRLMGISSANSSERDRFGDGDVTDTEEMEEGVANEPMTLTPIVSGSGNCPGAGLDLRGYGSASLIECVLTEIPVECLALHPCCLCL